MWNAVFWREICCSDSRIPTAASVFGTSRGLQKQIDFRNLNTITKILVSCSRKMSVGGAKDKKMLNE
jgi:hypothetical protein